MSLTRQQIELEAIQLPMEDRVQLVEMLLGSMNVNDKLERMWVAEAERRALDLPDGIVAGIPADEAMQHVRSSLLRHP